MASFLFCKTSSGAVRVTRIQLVLYCSLLALIIYILHGRKMALSMKSLHPKSDSMGLGRGSVMTDMSVVRAAVAKTPMETPWGAPIMWGGTRIASWRRTKFQQRQVHTGLLVLVVGTYSRFIRRFLASAETYFMPGRMVTYYVLTDRPNALVPPIKLGPERQLRVVPIAELPGWERLAHRRMALLVDALRDPVSEEVEYVFCADVDQEFMEPVGEEILGNLVATLHPELYGMPRNTFPYEIEEVSSACVEEDEGDFYYTSELYGGLVSEVYKMARSCSMLIQRDQANGVVARGLEESYLNRYLIDHRPTCVLSPEYSWWDSALAADVPVRRLVSLGRQCESYDQQTRERKRC